MCLIVTIANLSLLCLIVTFSESRALFVLRLIVTFLVGARCFAFDRYVFGWRALFCV